METTNEITEQVRKWLEEMRKAREQEESVLREERKEGRGTR
jgi:hypothetical protein